MSDDPWSRFRERIDLLQKDIARVRAVNVNNRDVRAAAEEAVTDYFQNARPALLAVLPEQVQNEIEGLMHILLRLSHGQNAKKSYAKILREIRRGITDIESLRLERIAVNSANTVPADLPVLERQIMDTLNRMLPSAALSYHQACQDLRDDNRSSYRGTAVELREALREILDRLAPDGDVSRMDGYKPETDSGKPSMRQKARYVLRNREVAENAAKAPEDATALIDGLAAQLVRSTYQMGNVGTHIATELGRVRQLKMYVDSVLCELLNVHQSARRSGPT
jgi:hypothetical protein